MFSAFLYSHVIFISAAATDNNGINGGDTSQKFANMPSVDDDTDSLSDIDDAEVCEYKFEWAYIM